MPSRARRSLPHRADVLERRRGRLGRPGSEADTPAPPPRGRGARGRKAAAAPAPATTEAADESADETEGRPAVGTDDDDDDSLATVAIIFGIAGLVAGLLALGVALFGKPGSASTGIGAAAVLLGSAAAAQGPGVAPSLESCSATSPNRFSPCGGAPPRSPPQACGSARPGRRLDLHVPPAHRLDLPFVDLERLAVVLLPALVGVADRRELALEFRIALCSVFE